MIGSPTLAIVGLGQLGQLLANRVQCDRLLLVSSDREKASRLAASLPHAEAAAPAQLSQASVVLMALPAHRMAEYYEHRAAFFHPKAVLINLATLLDTDSLRRTCDGHAWHALKVLGSVKALEQGGTTQLIADSEEARLLLAPHLSPLGEIIVGKEDWVVQCNRIATQCALEAALQIADGIRELGLPESFVYSAQTKVARGVIQSFADKTLGHFGQEMLEQVLARRAR